MTTTTRHLPAVRPRSAPNRWMADVARRSVLAGLSGITHGTLEILEPGRPPVRLGPGGGDLRATLHVRNPSFWMDMALGGSVGAGESYVAGDWFADDLVALVQLMVRNRAVLDGVEGGLARLMAPVRRLAHAWRRNSRAGSRKNIAAHYDLGNDFFELFLDETLTYSCAVFETEDTPLADASRAKLDRLCRKLDLSPGDHLLEIGTGWGSMALHAATHYGCRVTTTTISQQQYDVAVERIREAGLADRVTVLLQDYRDLTGRFDKLVSVEMIEAVGHQFLDTYLSACAGLLKPDGVMALQVITIQDQEYERAVREVDFIKKYVFPGSFIPSVTAVLDGATRATDLRLTHQEDFAPHYALTLRRWRENLHAQAEPISALGYDESFQRLWDYYLAYCEGGFAERFLGVSQMILAKPGARQPSLLPSLDGLRALR